MATKAELEYLVKVYDQQLQDLQREINKTNRALGKDTADAAKKGESALKKHADAIQKWSLVVTGAMLVGGMKAIDMAADLNEEISKSEAVFGKSSKGVLKWSKGMAKGFGISRYEALNFAGTFGNLLVPMGFARKEAAQSSKRFVELAADMASFSNTSPAEALEAIRAGLIGSSEPLLKYGVIVTEAKVAQEAQRLGLKKLNGAYSDHDKALARTSLIFRQTKDAQGDFKRTSSGAAAQQKIMRAQVDDLVRSLGQGLLPAWKGVLSVLSTVVQWMGKHQNVVKIGAAGVMGLAGAFLVLSTYVKISNLAMKGSVWGIVIAGLVGLTSALITAYKTSATFRKFVDDAFKKVKEAWAAVSSFFTEKIPETFNTVKDWFRTNWQEIAALISGPFFPLVAMATDAFGIRSAFMGAVHKLIGWVGGAASSVSKNFKRGLMAVAWDFPQLIYTRIIAPVIAGYRTLLGKAMELSRAVPRGIQAVFWNLIQLYRERIVWPLHNLGASVLSKGKELAGQIMTGIRNGMRDGAQAVLDKFKGFLNGIIGVFNKIPFVPDIPKFAQGGVVRGPTMALVGEDGPEVIIPLGAKRRKRGQELLTLAAKLLGTEGDYPGPFVSPGRAGVIPHFANGGFVIPGNAGNSFVSMQIALMRAAANKGPNFAQRIVQFAANGASKLIGMLPDVPKFPGDKLGMVSGFAHTVKNGARDALRDIFEKKATWSPDNIVQAYRWSLAQMGKPYKWGGGHGGWNFDLPGYDCSGYGSHAAKLAGAPLAAPGTTMSLYPMSKPGQGWFVWGFRGMGQSNPRKQHMGARVLGTWFQFGDPGRSGGSDSQWDAVRVPNALPGYRAGTPYVPRTGPALLHKGEAVIPANRNGGAGGPLVHIEHLEVKNGMDAAATASGIGQRLVALGF